MVSVFSIYWKYQLHCTAQWTHHCFRQCPRPRLSTIIASNVHCWSWEIIVIFDINYIHYQTRMLCILWIPIILASKRMSIEDLCWIDIGAGIRPHFLQEHFHYGSDTLLFSVILRLIQWLWSHNQIRRGASDHGRRSECDHWVNKQATRWSRVNRHRNPRYLTANQHSAS